MCSKIKTILYKIVVLCNIYFINCNDFGENKFLEFRNLQYSVNFHKEPILERNIIPDYEYTIQGVNKYMCSIELLKKHTEMDQSLKMVTGSQSENSAMSIPDPAKTYDDLLEVLSHLKNICSLAVPMGNQRYIYIICYYHGIKRFQFIENFQKDTIDIGYFSDDKIWSTNELNLRNVNMDSLVSTEGTHIQNYLSNVTCPNNLHNKKESYYKTTLKFRCNINSNVTKVIGIVELTPCHIEITLETNIICDFPVFSRRIQYSNEPSMIDCYPMISQRYADIQSMIKITRVESPNDTLFSILSTVPSSLILPLYTKLSLISPEEIEILKNTKFVTQLLPDSSEILTSETSGKIKDGDFDIKIKLHKIISRMNNKHYKINIERMETIKYLESINITNIYEQALQSLINSVNVFENNSQSTATITIQQNLNDNDDVIDDDDDDGPLGFDELPSSSSLENDKHGPSELLEDNEPYIELGQFVESKKHS